MRASLTLGRCVAVGLWDHPHVRLLLLLLLVRARQHRLELAAVGTGGLLLAVRAPELADLWIKSKQ